MYFGFLKPKSFEEKYFGNIKKYFVGKRLDNIRLGYVQVIKNSINDSVSKIEECVNDGGEWGIDVVGGSEMLLLSAGIVYGKHDNITLFRVDPVSGAARFIDKSVTDSLDPLVFTSQMRKYPKKLRLENTVEENVLLHGGAVGKYTGSGAFVYTDDFLCDIEKLWKLCAAGPRGYVHKRSAPQTWNSFSVAVAGMEKLGRHEQAELLKRKYKVGTYLEELKRLGLVRYEKNSDGSLYAFAYKNSQVRECIVKAGNLLEQRVYLTCRRFLGHGLCDVKTGVTIAWNQRRMGANTSDNVGTENEIDVLAMRGALPVFISCKNGRFESEELYKLYSVAERFGTRYAKKILVATDLEHALEARNAEYLKARATEMNIEIIDNVHRMSDTEFEKVLRIKLFN